MAEGQEKEIMTATTCPHCRRSMRLWAIDWRRTEKPELKALCLRTAIEFRSGACYHKRLDAQARSR